MSEDENPFENIPDDFSDSNARTARGIATSDRGKATPPSPSDFRNLPPLSPEIASRSRYAMASGFGFVLLVVLFYLGIVLEGGVDSYFFGILGMILSTLMALFYMLDDLRIRPRKVTDRGTKFIAGIIWALLLLFCFAMTAVLWTDLVRLIFLDAIIVLTNASFALFFYSMLWED